MFFRHFYTMSLGNRLEMSALQILCANLTTPMFLSGGVKGRIRAWRDPGSSAWLNGEFIKQVSSDVFLETERFHPYRNPTHVKESSIAYNNLSAKEMIISHNKTIGVRLGLYRFVLQLRSVRITNNLRQPASIYFIQTALVIAKV